MYEVHPALQYAIEQFEREERLRSDPVIAILGPPSSGKTLLLMLLLQSVSNKARKERVWTTATIDLFGIRPGSEEEMSAVFLQRLKAGLQEANVAVTSHHGSARKQIDEIVKSAVGFAIEGLVLAFDHIESVSREFADNLSQRIRALKEAADEVPGMGNLAIVVAGCVSLSELTANSKSAFETARVVALPITGGAQVDTYVRGRLSESGFVDLSEEVVGRFVDETCGELTFIDVLIRHVRQLMTTGGLCCNEIIDAAIAQITVDELPQLRHAYLHLSLNKELREIASKLISGKGLPGRSPASDIDQYQLMGVVVLDRSVRRPTYRFRNAVMRRAAWSMCSPQGSVPVEPDMAKSLQDIHEAHRYIEHAVEIDDCHGPLHAAWAILVGSAQPRLHIVVSDPEFAVRNCHEIPDSSGEPPSSVFGSIIRSASTNIDSFAASGSTISYAMWLGQKQGVRAWLVATMAKSSSGLAEFAFQHWRLFITAIDRSLIKLALADIGRKRLQEKTQGLEFPSLETQSAAQLYFDPRGQLAVVFGKGELTAISGRLDPEWSERAHKVDLKLVRGRSTKQEFEHLVEEAGGSMDAALRDLKGLKARLTDGVDVQNWVVGSPMEGLKFPLELLHGVADKVPLLLRTGIARRIQGLIPPRSVNLPFVNLLRFLRESGKSLRILLVGADHTEELRVEDELDEVRRKIEAGCAALNMKPPLFVTVLSEHASGKVVQENLARSRPFHIFHFCGHAFHTPHDSSVACIRLNDRGKAQDIPSDILQAWLLDAGLWLCFMSACQTASFSGEGILTSGGMIADILQAGVPNYIGFRWPVTAESARQFASSFYERLLEPPVGNDLLGATLYARRAARGAAGMNDAWASSILVTQCPT